MHKKPKDKNNTQDSLMLSFSISDKSNSANPFNSKNSDQDSNYHSDEDDSSDQGNLKKPKDDKLDVHKGPKDKNNTQDSLMLSSSILDKSNLINLSNSKNSSQDSNRNSDENDLSDQENPEEPKNDELQEVDAESKVKNDTQHHKCGCRANVRSDWIQAIKNNKILSVRKNLQYLKQSLEFNGICQIHVWACGARLGLKKILKDMDMKTAIEQIYEQRTNLWKLKMDPETYTMWQKAQQPP